MLINLTEQEGDLLARIIDQYYSTLREEIVKTEGFEMKHDLKEEEVIVKSLLEKVRSAGGALR